MNDERKASPEKETGDKAAMRCDGTGRVLIDKTIGGEDVTAPCRSTGCHPVKCDAAGRHPAAPAPAPLKVGDGIALIAAERERQVSAEGWTPEHDDEHADGALARAAACYALAGHGLRYRRVPDGCILDYQRDDGMVSVPVYWPWASDAWKPRDRVRDLVRAGALIAAEIDRLRRADLRRIKPEKEMPATDSPDASCESERPMEAVAGCDTPARGESPWPSGEGWRCESCGEMAGAMPDPAWRWMRDRWQHGHGQAGYYNARYFGGARGEAGEPVREAERELTIVELRVQNADLRARLDSMTQQAQSHAQEARTQRATVHEIYQIVSGATGEPGDWHGADPVREAFTDLRARLAAAERERQELRERLRSVCQTLVAAVGADGPCFAQDAADHIVARLAASDRRVEELTRLAKAVADAAWSFSQHAPAFCGRDGVARFEAPIAPLNELIRARTELDEFLRLAAALAKEEGA